MRNKYIIEMIDGGIIDIETDEWAKSYGCETCGYGGLHVKKMELLMKNMSLLINMEDMYEWGLPSYEDLIRWFDKNTEKIKSMTQDEFVYFIKNNHQFSCDEIKFSIKKDI